MVKSKTGDRNKVLVDTKSKGNRVKRWKKGHSCATNPQTNKHRLAAKERLFSVNSGPSNLTVDALARHEAQHADEHHPGCCADMDTHSIGAHSAAKTNFSWASQMTDCTNVTFAKVMGRFTLSNSAQHKEVIAVLAAVSEEIKSRGGSESNTEYFAALMTIFDAELDDQSAIAVAYLLSVVIKRVPVSALRVRFSDIARSLASKLGSHTDASDKAEGSSLIRSVICCLSHLLSALDRSAWASEYTVHVFRTLLPFVTSSKAKVRKAAHHAMGTILRGSCFMKVDGKPSGNLHPASTKLAKYCIQEMELLRSSGNVTAILHILELLKNVMSEFPENSLKLVCTQLLSLLDLRHMLLSDVIMKTMHSLFLMRPRETSLSSDLNKELVSKLYLYKPNEVDTQQMASWLFVMEQAHCNWIRLNEADCLVLLPDLFKVCMKCLGTGKVAVAKTAANVLITLLKDCVLPAAPLAVKLVQETPPGSSCAIHKMFRYVEAGLGYQYMSNWDLVLSVIAQFFEVLGSKCHSIMKKCMLALAELRGCHGFEHQELLDKTFGMAIRVMGPKVVLDAVPLQTSLSLEEVDLTRSWIIPVMRDHIEKTELAFFATYFLPLASLLKSKCADCTNSGRMVELKTWSAFFSQIWSLLPGFCTQPTDLSKAFPLVAQTLGECISSRAEVRMEILSALRKLCAHCVTDEERQVVGKYAKNFIPILANLIAPVSGEKGDASRLSALETLKCYLKVADKKEISNFYSKCSSKVTDKETTASRRPLLMDMIIAFVPHLKFSELCDLLAMVTDLIEGNDKSVQKKSFRILEEISAANIADCKKFMTSQQSKLKKLFLESVVTANASSTAPRLRFATKFLKCLEVPDLDFLQTLLPEALLSTKATGEKARAASYLLIIEIGQTYMRWHPKLSQQEAIRQYVIMMMAGLVGNPQMVSCTILALTKLVHDHKGLVQVDLLERLVDNGCVLLMSKAREVVLSAIGFIKTLILAFDKTFGQFLEKVVSSLVSMKDDNRHHFRFKTKELFTLLVRKFGFNVVYEMVPENLHKLFNNMRKSDERKERQKVASSTERDISIEGSRKRKSETIDEMLHSSDSELDDNSEDEKPAKKKVKRTQRSDAKGGAWLKEDEDIVDFLDASAVKKVLATRPSAEAGKSRDKSVKHDFKLAADGRLIITDDSMQQDAKNSNKKKCDDENIDQLLDAAEGTTTTSRKRRMSSAPGRDDYSDINFDDDRRSTATGNSAVYRAGGKGIHRQLGKKQEKDFGKEYRAKKAGGDMKKSGKPDPFAYVPLEHQFLNKRKKAKAAGQFKHLVKGARKGALKGNKLRNKQKKAK